ncbi:MAG: hypothetical protein AAB846_00200 [Patescibacteria group bacterium]
MILEHTIKFFKNEEGQQVVLIDDLPGEMRTMSEKQELFAKARDLQKALADFTYGMALELLPYNLCGNQTQ